MTRLVAITGASAGIGRAAALEFARRGDRLALLARGEAGLAGARAQVRELGAEVLTVPTDVADPAQLATAVERIEAEMGPIDVWVNVAFTSVFARFGDITPAEYKRVTEVSYLGYVYATMAVLPRMRRRGHGTIVHVGSTLAYRGIPLQTAYCGAKHAIQGFHEAVRCELLSEHSPVRVTMVQLPALNTPQFSWVLSRLAHQAQPVPPIYQPEVAARAIRYAADHPQRREYWVGASRSARCWPTRSSQACWTATWPAPASPRSRRASRNPRTSRPTSGSLPTDPPGATTARTAPSTPDPVRPARNSGSRTATRSWRPRSAWPPLERPPGGRWLDADEPAPDATRPPTAGDRKAAAFGHRGQPAGAVRPPRAARLRLPRRRLPRRASRTHGQRLMAVRTDLGLTRGVRRPGGRARLLRRHARRAVRLGWVLRTGHPDLAQPVDHADGEDRVPRSAGLPRGPAPAHPVAPARGHRRHRRRRRAAGRLGGLRPRGQHGPRRRIRHLDSDVRPAGLPMDRRDRRETRPPRRPSAALAPTAGAASQPHPGDQRPHPSRARLGGGPVVEHRGVLASLRAPVRGLGRPPRLPARLRGAARAYRPRRRDGRGGHPGSAGAGPVRAATTTTAMCGYATRPTRAWPSASSSPMRFWTRRWPTPPPGSWSTATGWHRHTGSTGACRRPRSPSSFRATPAGASSSATGRGASSSSTAAASCWRCMPPRAGTTGSAPTTCGRVSTLVDVIDKRWDAPDAGVWELDNDWWTHSRLACVAGLRAAAAHVAAADSARLVTLAEAILADHLGAGTQRGRLLAPGSGPARRGRRATHGASTRRRISD